MPSSPTSNLPRATHAGWWNMRRPSPSSSRRTWPKPAACCCISCRTAGQINLTAGGFFADARKQGHVLVASGWQGDLEPAGGIETMPVPVAKNPDGSSITGRVLARFSDMPADATTLPILRGGVAGTADPASLDTSKATLTRRASENGKVIPLRSTDWAFADCSQTPFPGKPDPRKTMPERRVQSRLLVRTGLHRKGPESLWHRFRRHARFELLASLWQQDDTGDGQSCARARSPRRSARATRSPATSSAA